MPVKWLRVHLKGWAYCQCSPSTLNGVLLKVNLKVVGTIKHLKVWIVDSANHFPFTGSDFVVVCFRDLIYTKV